MEANEYEEVSKMVKRVIDQLIKENVPYARGVSVALSLYSTSIIGIIQDGITQEEMKQNVTRDFHGILEFIDDFYGKGRNYVKH